MVAPAEAGRITALLVRWNGGDASARDELVSLVYGELRRMAAARLRGTPGGSLQPTVLVHEVYLRLAGADAMQWQNRAHFFAVAARAMRQIVVDEARRKHAAKRGGHELRVTLDEGIAAEREEVDLVALDGALERLAAADEYQARLVEMRFFGGLTFEEIAVLSDLSLATVKRRWRLARAWLFRELAQ
jgi:RNA polymerase sigma factor (TIGR02999 family)